MSARSIVVSLSVAAVATTAFLAGCSSDSSSTSPGSGASTPASSSTAPAASPSPTSASPSEAASSPSTSETSAGGSDVSAAAGKVAWVMPCADPEQQEIGLNEKDKEDFVQADGWRCGEPPKTTAAAFVAELRKPPASDKEAASQLRAAAEQIVQSSKVKEGDFLGHPGISSDVTQNGRTFSFQGVAVDKYLVIFVAPEGKLAALTDTVTIS